MTWHTLVTVYWPWFTYHNLDIIALMFIVWFAADQIVRHKERKAAREWKGGRHAGERP